MTAKELEEKVQDLELRLQVLEYDKKDMAYTHPVYVEETYTQNYPYCQE